MEISKNSVVSLTYTLRESSEEGQVLEVVEAAQPLLFLCGVGTLFPVFESNLNGKKEGDTFDFILKSNDAYGPFDEKHIAELPIENFIVDGVLQKEMMEIGLTITMTNGEGEAVRATVLEVNDEKVKMDFNHLLAGKDLHFKGKVEGVRAATAEELEHGHAHGPGGHEHAEEA